MEMTRDRWPVYWLAAGDPLPYIRRVQSTGGPSGRPRNILKITEIDHFNEISKYLFFIYKSYLKYSELNTLLERAGAAGRSV